MLGAVAACINSVVGAGVWALAVGAQVGQTLAALVGALAGALTDTRDCIALLLRENEGFFTELPELVLGAPEAALNQVSCARDAVLSVYDTLLARLGALLSAIVMLAHNVRNAVILVGQGAWLLVTFIPLRLPILIGDALSYLGAVVLRLTLEAYGKLLTLGDFLSAVPMESLVGLVGMVAIVRLAVDFRHAILDILTAACRSAVRNLLCYYYAVHNYFTPHDAVIVAHIADDIVPDDDPSNAIDSLCVICRERRKCVLLLPCRHICLCRECCMTLSSYQRTCPICRTYMTNTVTVYV